MGISDATAEELHDRVSALEDAADRLLEALVEEGHINLLDPSRKDNVSVAARALAGVVNDER